MCTCVCLRPKMIIVHLLSPALLARMDRICSMIHSNQPTDTSPLNSSVLETFQRQKTGNQPKTKKRKNTEVKVLRCVGGPKHKPSVTLTEEEEEMLNH